LSIIGLSYENAVKKFGEIEIQAWWDGSVFKHLSTNCGFCYDNLDDDYRITEKSKIYRVNCLVSDFFITENISENDLMEISTVYSQTWGDTITLYFEYENFGVCIYYHDDNTIDMKSLVTVEKIENTKNDEIFVILNEDMLKLDTSPIIENERILVLFQAIFEALGAVVDWDEKTLTVVGALGDTTIKLTIGETTAYVNDKAIELDVAPKIQNDRTLVPLSFMAENFDFQVDMDGDLRQIIITTPNGNK